MKPAQHPTALRTSQLLRLAGIDTRVVEFEQPTRTSDEAAAPIGHSQPVKLLLDEDRQRFETVWAAAGTPFSVFPVKPEELRSLTGAD